MITNLIFNLLAGLFALSLTSSVALHDSRIDAALLSVVTPVSDTSHDLTHAMSHDLHVHGNRLNINNTDPTVNARTHKKHVAAHHSRMKLAALSA